MAAAAGAAAAVAFILIVVYELWSVQSELDSARRELSALSLASISDGGGLGPTIEGIVDDVHRADRHANHPALGVASAVPGLGRQIEGLRDVTGALVELSDHASTVVGDIERSIDQADSPAGKIAVVDTTARAVDDIRADIAALGALSTDGLLPPLSGAVGELNRKLSEAHADLGEIRGDLETVRDVLVGPTRFLLVAANNAEVRGGMGMHLSGGVITISDGEFETTDFYPTSALTAITEGTANYPAELDELFGGIWAFGREWRTTSTTPNFPVVGDVLAQLSAATPLGPVDGVISVDAPALGSLLEAVGPVEAQGLTITADNAVDELLRENYIRLGETDQRQERYELQSEVATAIFDAVTERPIDLLVFASALQRAAEGRNLFAWSSDPDVQSLWEMLGADGSLTAHDVLVAFQNASASKRDYYIHPLVAITAVESEDPSTTRYRITAELENPVVDPEPWYVTTLSRHAAPDVHRTYITFTLPGAARDVTTSGGYSPRIGTDGPTVLATTWLQVPVTETGMVTLEFSLPRQTTWVRLVPAARVQPTIYELGSVVATDETYTWVPLPRTAALAAPSPKWAHAAALTLTFVGLVFLVARERRRAGQDPDLRGARTDGYLATLMFALSFAVLVMIAVN